MALDLAAQMIYWTDTKTHWVMRGPMDGSAPPEVLYDEDSSDLDDPWDIELDVIIAPPHPGDTNGDERVNDLDYNNLVTQFGGAPGLQSADFNTDGLVDLNDFVAMRQNFGFGESSQAPGAFATPAPEPATLSMLALCGMAILRRARSAKKPLAS
jgi:hypothetical protein